MESWHVIYTKPRAEKKVEERLNNFGIEAYCPVKQQIKQWSDRKKKILVPVLPSMVLVNIDEKERNKVFDILQDLQSLYPVSIKFSVTLLSVFLHSSQISSNSFSIILFLSVSSIIVS